MAAPALNPFCHLSIFLFMVGMLIPPSHAQEVPPPAYQLAAQRAGIPSAVLYAVALQESGIQREARIVPWPWSLNVAGRSYRYGSRKKACAGLHKALRETSPKRVDVGLGQVNLGYQKRHYRRPCDLLDPYFNLRVAATILREQYKPGESWLSAMGRYHRPAGGEPAARYRRSVSRHLERVQGPSGALHKTK